jgi:hypothetical protein
MKLYPKCHPVWIEGDKVHKVKEPMVVTHSAIGVVLPCCMCFMMRGRKEFEELGMFDDELKIQNVSKIDDIILSKQWLTFHRILLETPEKAPSICKEKCSVKVDTLYDK